MRGLRHIENETSRLMGSCSIDSAAKGLDYFLKIGRVEENRVLLSNFESKMVVLPI